MTLEESEEYIEILKETNSVLAETNRSLRERVEYLERNLRIVEKAFSSMTYMRNHFENLYKNSQIKRSHAI